MNPLNSKSYPRIMFLLLIVASLLILFNIVNILDSANRKMIEKTLTGYAIENSVSNSTSNPPINFDNNSIQKNSELNSTRPYVIFYVFLIGIIMAILVTFLILKSTVNKNIELEENERSF